MPSDWRYADVKKLLESHGWELDRIRGSHHVFSGVGRRTLPIPVHKKKVSFEYVRLIQREIARLEEDDQADG